MGLEHGTYNLTETEKKFLDEIKIVASKISNTYAHKSCILFHHNDADGIASGAILSTAFSRMGMRVARYCLEKPFPIAIERILEERDEPLIVITDFGSGMISLIESLAPTDSQILFLDHHQLEKKNDNNLSRSVILNPIAWGIDGAKAASAATVCALFASAVSPDNRDLSWLGVLGWRGDGQDDRGLNHQLLIEARDRGDITGESGDEQVVESRFSLNSVIEGVNALGAFDYLRGGPDIAMKGLISGNIEGLLQIASAARRRYEELWRDGEAITVVEHDSGLLAWLSLSESFAGFGVKTVGLMCEDLIARGRVSKNRYLVGFQQVADEIPGIGPVAIDQVKVSMRLPPEIAERVKRGDTPPLTEILPQAAREIGGFVDGCHPHAAAVSIDKGKEQLLLDGLARAIASWRPS
jgi:single-stranded-DNA-specific exonuclease